MPAGRRVGKCICGRDEGECVTVNPAGCQFENPKDVTDACGNTFKQCLGEVQRLKETQGGGQAFPIKWGASTGGLFETTVVAQPGAVQELVAACANDSVCGQATGTGFLTCCNEELDGALGAGPAVGAWRRNNLHGTA